MDIKNIQEFFWPTIKDAESAKKAADQGFIAAMLFFLKLSPGHFFRALCSRKPGMS